MNQPLLKCRPLELNRSQTDWINDDKLDKDEQTEALKFLIHFLGDIHQSLHVEALDRGGNEIHVCFYDRCARDENLHGIWDTDILHKINDLKHNLKHNKEKEPAAQWAASLFQTNRFRPRHAECSDIQNPLECAMLRARETNRLDCDYVLKNGVNCFGSKKDEDGDGETDDMMDREMFLGYSI